MTERCETNLLLSPQSEARRTRQIKWLRMPPLRKGQYQEIIRAVRPKEKKHTIEELAVEETTRWLWDYYVWKVSSVTRSTNRRGLVREHAHIMKLWKWLATTSHECLRRRRQKPYRVAIDVEGILCSDLLLFAHASLRFFMTIKGLNGR